MFTFVIFSSDFSEFVPYVFQILSLLLEQHKRGTIPEPYMVLFPCLLAPVLWERPGNIHPLVQLLQAFVQTGAAQISASQKLVSQFIAVPTLEPDVTPRIRSFAKEYIEYNMLLSKSRYFSELC
jgi:hypothetical protein